MLCWVGLASHLDPGCSSYQGSQVLLFYLVQASGPGPTLARQPRSLQLCLRRNLCLYVGWIATSSHTATLNQVRIELARMPLSQVSNEGYSLRRAGALCIPSLKPVSSRPGHRRLPRGISGIRGWLWLQT